MEWTVIYQLLRDGALSDDERRALGDLTMRARRKEGEGESFGLALSRRARADRVVALGRLTLLANLVDQTYRDADTLVSTLNEARSLLPGSELRLRDSCGFFGLTDDGLCELHAPVTAEPVELDPWSDVGAFDHALAWASAPPTPAPRPPESDLDIVLRWFAEYQTLPEHLRYARELHAAKLRRDQELQPVWAAMSRISDVGPLIGPFLELWTRTTTNFRWHVDLELESSFELRLAAHPEIISRMRADVDAAGARGSARAERGMWILSRSWNDEILAFFLQIGIRARHRKPGFDGPLAADALRPLAQQILAQHADPRCFASFVLELDAMPSVATAADGAMAAALSAIDPVRAKPIVLALIQSPGLLFEATIMALVPLDDPAAREELARRLGATSAPRDEWIRARLAERGLDIKPIPPDRNAPRWSKPRWRLSEAQRRAHLAEEASALAKLGIAAVA